MAGNTLDFKKIDTAFQHLADTQEGGAALSSLQKALDDVGKQANGLNDHEVYYLLTNLVQQRQGGGFGANIRTATGGARVKNGFLIKTAVPE